MGFPTNHQWDPSISIHTNRSKGRGSISKPGGSPFNWLVWLIRVSTSPYIFQLRPLCSKPLGGDPDEPFRTLKNPCHCGKPIFHPSASLSASAIFPLNKAGESIQTLKRTRTSGKLVQMGPVHRKPPIWTQTQWPSPTQWPILHGNESMF